MISARLSFDRLPQTDLVEVNPQKLHQLPRQESQRSEVVDTTSEQP